MPAQLIDLGLDHELAETIGDAALAALLQSKPDDEGIPPAVWWLVAEALRTSVALRRALTGTAATEPGVDAGVLLAEATLLTDAALAELADTTDARPAPVLVAVPEGAPDDCRPDARLRLSVLFLARALIGHRPVTPARLASLLAAHRRALGLVGC